MATKELSDLCAKVTINTSREELVGIFFEAEPAERYVLAEMMLEAHKERLNDIQDVMSEMLCWDMECADPLVKAAAHTYYNEYGRGAVTKHWKQTIEGQGGILLRNLEGSSFWFVHKSAQQPGKWQVTMYPGTGGGPTGDMQFPSLKEVFDGPLDAGIPTTACVIPEHNVDAVLQKLHEPAQQPQKRQVAAAAPAMC